MTNPLYPAPRTTNIIPNPRPTGTLQQGTGGYVMHRLGASLPATFDAGHLLPSKELDAHTILTPASRANMWNFFGSNLKALFPNHNFTMPEAQGKAEIDSSPATPGNLRY